VGELPLPQASLMRHAKTILAILILVGGRAWASGARPPTASRPSPTRVLMIYGEGAQAALTAQWVVPALTNLLGHFEVITTVLPAGAYRAGQIEGHDVAIYLGLPGAGALSDALVSDLCNSSHAVCWLGGGLDQAARRFSPDRYGFRVDGTSGPDTYPRVTYRSQILKRPRMPLTRLAVTHRPSCQVLASVDQGGPPLAYAVRSGRFWYFADVPLMELSETGSYLVLSDQLHEVLGQQHSARRTAMICIANVTAETPAGTVRALAGYLSGEKLPYAIAVVPIFRDPRAEIEVRLSSRRALVGAVRGAQRAGAAIIAEGLTHQLMKATGEDGEFWDMARNRPPVGHTPAHTDERMREAIAELGRCGLYPVAWSTPEGRASSADYAEIARRFSTTWERRLTSVLAPAPQPLPFLVSRDSFGERVVPDNLSPLRRGGQEVETILEQVRCHTVVSDPWVTVSVSPSAPLEAVRVLIAGLREMDYEFADLRRSTNWVLGQSLEIHTTGEPGPVLDFTPRGWDATVLGPGRRDLKHFERAGRDDRNEALLQPGAILITYPTGSRPHEVFALEGQPEELAQRAVTAIARIAVIFAIGACLLFLLIYLAQVSLQRRS